MDSGGITPRHAPAAHFSGCVLPRIKRAPSIYNGEHPHRTVGIDRINNDVRRHGKNMLILASTVEAPVSRREWQAYETFNLA
jgi:hypothetical protein